MSDYNISTTNLSNYTFIYCGDSNLERGVKLTAVFLIDWFGVLGNIFVIVLAKRMPVRKVLHHLIVNMAIADALFLAMDLLSSIPYFSLDPLPFPDNILGAIICKTKALAINVSQRVSLVSLLVISVLRFRATRRTLLRSQPFTLTQRVALLGLCWLIPTITSIVDVLGANVDNHRCKNWLVNSFLTFSGVDTIYLLLNIALNIIVAVVILVLSICTTRRLSKPQNINNHLNEEQRNRRASRTRAAVKMVLASVLLYTCCWLPPLSFMSQMTVGYDDVHFSGIDCASSQLFGYVLVVISYLPLVNCCFSPYIYIIFLPDFREAAKKVLCRKAINRRVDQRNSVELLQISTPQT